MTGNRLWCPNAQAELLAWVDFCKENGLDFEETIEGHLKESTGKEFTRIQVKTRILRWCRGAPFQIYARPNCSKFKIVQEKGSLCISDLSEGIRESVRKKLLQYREEGAQIIEPIPSIAASNHDGETQPEPSQYHCSSGLSANERRRSRFVAAQQMHFQNSLQSSQSTAEARSSVSREGTIGNNEGRARRLTALNGDGQPHRPAAQNAPATQEQRQEAATAEEKCNERLRQKDAEIREIQTLWQDEVYGFYKREEALKRKIAELEAQNKHMIIARQERERAGKEPLEELLYLKTHENWRLTQWIHDAERISQFARFDSVGPNSLEEDDIERFMKHMQSELESILCGHEFGSRLLLPRPERNSDLGSLVRCVFGGENDSGSWQQLKICLSKFSPQTTIRALLLASLKMWVFEVDFPNFNPTENRYLNAYREVMLGFGGWKQLKGLDLAAYNLLSESEWFKKGRIPFRSAALSVRLSKALAPFFVAGTRDSGTNIFDTWGEEPAVWKLRQENFSRVFEIALNFKTATVKSSQQFEFVVYQPGLLVGGAIIPSLAQHQNRGQETLEEEFWKIASIHVYEGEVSQPRDLLADALIQPRNFLCKTTKERLERSLFRKDILLPKIEFGTRSQIDESSKISVLRLTSLKGLDKTADGILPPENHGSNSLISRPMRQVINSQSVSNETMTEATLGLGPTPDALIASEQTGPQQEDSNETDSQNIAAPIPRRTDRQPSPTEGRSSTTVEKHSRPAGPIVPPQSRKRSRKGDEISRRLVCDKCGGEFENSAHLQTHQTKQTCSRCPECGKTYRIKADLMRHEDIEHGSEYSLTHNPSEKCGTCSKRFENKPALNAHLQEKSCSRCIECQRGFETHLELENHQRSQHEMDPYTSDHSSGQRQRQDASSKTRHDCIVCNKVFPGPQSQKMHYNIQDVDPVECPRCHETFIGRASLKRPDNEERCEISVTETEAGSERDEGSRPGDGLSTEPVGETDTTMEDVTKEYARPGNGEEMPSLLHTSGDIMNARQPQFNGTADTEHLEDTLSMPWTERNSISRPSARRPDFDAQESEEKPLLRMPEGFDTTWPAIRDALIGISTPYLRHSSY